MKTEYQLEIIGKIRRLREFNRCSQAQLAKYLGVSDGQIGNVESTKYPQKYTLSQLHKICTLFKTPIQHLFIDENEYIDNHIDIIDLLIQKIIRYEE